MIFKSTLYNLKNFDVVTQDKHLLNDIAYSLDFGMSFCGKTWGKCVVYEKTGVIECLFGFVGYLTEPNLKVCSIFILIGLLLGISWYSKCSDVSSVPTDDQISSQSLPDLNYSTVANHPGLIPNRLSDSRMDYLPVQPTKCISMYSTGHKRDKQLNYL